MVKNLLFVDVIQDLKVISAKSQSLLLITVQPIIVKTILHVLVDLTYSLAIAVLAGKGSYAINQLLIIALKIYANTIVFASAAMDLTPVPANLDMKVICANLK